MCGHFRGFPPRSSCRYMGEIPADPTLPATLQSPRVEELQSSQSTAHALHLSCRPQSLPSMRFALRSLPVYTAHWERAQLSLRAAGSSPCQRLSCVITWAREGAAVPLMGQEADTREGEALWGCRGLPAQCRASPGSSGAGPTCLPVPLSSSVPSSSRRCDSSP